MRVWALASCGGLLALGACSADQANTGNPNSTPPDVDNLAQAKPSSPIVTPSPLTRPEMLSRQALSARPRLNPAAVSAGADQAAPQPQAGQLRARLQRLRDQQRTRLAPTAAPSGAPIATTAKVVASPIPQPGVPILQPAASTPDADRERGLAIASQPPSPAQSPLTANPTPLPPLQPPAPKVDVEPSGTAADLQSVAAASIASNYPLAPLRHQGHSARHSARLASPQTLVPASTSHPPVASARLHGNTALATPPRANNIEPGSETEAISVPDLPQDSVALLADAPRATVAQGHATVQSRTGIAVTLARSGDLSGAAPGGGAHGQESTAPPRSAPRGPSQASLAPHPDSPVAEGQGLGAIALPESLPLNSATPRLNPQRPRLSVAPAAVFPAADSPLTVSADRATNEPAVSASDLPPAGHLSPIDRGSFYLVPIASQSPKGLPLAHCPTTRANTPPNDRRVDGEIVAQPSFSGRSQSMTLGKEAPLALCRGNALTPNIALEPLPAAAPGPHDLDFPPASVADLDLDSLAPDPTSD